MSGGVECSSWLVDGKEEEGLVRVEVSGTWSFGGVSYRVSYVVRGRRKDGRVERDRWEMGVVELYPLR